MNARAEGGRREMAKDPRQARRASTNLAPRRHYFSNTLSQCNRFQCASGGAVDERTVLLQEPLYRSPLRHENFELTPRGLGFGAGQGDHSGIEGTDSVHFPRVALDTSVPGDDEPALSTTLRNPHVILGADIGDDAWRAGLLVHRPAGVTWKRYVGTQLRQQFSEPEDVRV